MGRKIPGRKHRGIRDPEKQAAVRFESIKNKVNAPPSNPEHQEVSKSLQRIIDLKNKTKTGEIFTKRNKKRTGTNLKKNINSDKFSPSKPEKPARNFVQFPDETDREFVRRMNRICMETVKEAKFEEKYGVEIKRNEQGKVEVVKRKKDELELLYNKEKKRKLKEEKGLKKKKKSKDKTETVKLSKWQKRNKKLKEKKGKRGIENIDEFKEYKDPVKFGEIVHAPPTLIKPKKAEKILTVPRPGNKSLLLKSVLNNSSSQINQSKNIKDNSHKTSHKVIDKKGKRKELPNSLRRQLDKQQQEIIDAYKQLKSKKYVGT
ncbi:DNA ligase 1 [Diorhabda sublineata]|uniref:DNA ligase 1 n=1 Tax=Diorhabda sublineata TaxID=1163346 RepID=UPI0024E0F7E9|nr:DNA ligase 1 [Diorhabda sublineata]